MCMRQDAGTGRHNARHNRARRQHFVLLLFGCDMIEPLNFCRQMVRQFGETLAEKRIEPWMREQMSHAIDLSAWSTKYMLPMGGLILDDPEFRGLENVERIRLPQKYIALEYARPQGEVAAHERPCSKAIVFVREGEEFIIVTPVFWHDLAKAWVPMEPVGIRPSDYVQKGLKFESGSPAFKVIIPNAKDRKIQWPVEDYQDELTVLMHFLNALACANVKSERLNTPKRKVKAAIPFDEYHILTIDCPKSGATCKSGQHGESRSPREHLRRGHIRRLEDGRKIWINATVVNHGVGGKVGKEYSVRNPREAALKAMSSN